MGHRCLGAGITDVDMELSGISRKLESKIGQRQRTMNDKLKLIRVLRSLQKESRICTYCQCKEGCPALENNGGNFTKKDRTGLVSYRMQSVDQCIIHKIEWIMNLCDENGEFKID